MTGTHAIRWFLPAAPSAVATVRHRTIAQLRFWGFYMDPDTEADLQLVVSELVTNAVRYGTGVLITIGLYAKQGQVFVEVLDGSRTPPVTPAVKENDEAGRGLTLVATLAADWGTHPTPGGKSVWASLALPPQRVAVPVDP